MPFRFSRLAIPEVILVEAKIMGDERGFFQEVFKASAFQAEGLPTGFVQDNHSHSQRGILRGLHYQLAPHAQGKLVMAVWGQVFDVAVDIRRGSPTYGQWIGQELSARNGCMLYVPAGFAHGFCVVSDEADVLYRTTDEYAPELERGLRWNDPALGIAWPIENPRVSARDAQYPGLAEAEINAVYELPRRDGTR